MFIALTPESVFWGILPSLESFPVEQKVRRLPVVVRLVAIGDDRPESGRQPDGDDQLEREIAW